MDVFVSISAGIIIVWLALFLIKKEVKKASFFKHVQKQNMSMAYGDDVISQVQRLEGLVDEMNQSFYDIVNDLEGHYSQHEKEIDDINLKLEKMNQGLEDLTRSIYYQGRELEAFSHEKTIDKKKTPRSEDGDVKIYEPAKQTAYQEAMRLKALGYDDHQIAKRMNKGIREVAMLLNFKK